jgi:hypothetical protein
MLMRPFKMSLLLATLLLSLPANAQKLDVKSLRNILAKQGFTGLLDGQITFDLLGTMRCNSAAISVYYYTWEETNPPGRAIHSSQRLIFLENWSYLGQYVVEDRPVLVKPDLLRFPYSEGEGNTIQCDKEGLPKSLLLNGEDITFFR